MEQWQQIRYNKLIEVVERSIGRGVTEEENSKLQWLAGWDQSTVNVVTTIITAAHEHGQKKQ